MAIRQHREVIDDIVQQTPGVLARKQIQDFFGQERHSGSNHLMWALYEQIGWFYNTKISDGIRLNRDGTLYVARTYNPNTRSERSELLERFPLGDYLSGCTKVQLQLCDARSPVPRINLEKTSKGTVVSHIEY